MQDVPWRDAQHFVGFDLDENPIVFQPFHQLGLHLGDLHASPVDFTLV